MIGCLSTGKRKRNALDVASPRARLGIRTISVEVEINLAESLYSEENEHVLRVIRQGGYDECVDKNLYDGCGRA